MLSQLIDLISVSQWMLSSYIPPPETPPGRQDTASLASPSPTPLLPLRCLNVFVSSNHDTAPKLGVTKNITNQHLPALTVLRYSIRENSFRLAIKFASSHYQGEEQERSI